MILRVPDETAVTLSPEKRGVTEGKGENRTYTTDFNDTLE